MNERLKQHIADALRELTQTNAVERSGAAQIHMNRAVVALCEARDTLEASERLSVTFTLNGRGPLHPGDEYDIVDGKVVWNYQFKPGDVLVVSALEDR